MRTRTASFAITRHTLIALVIGGLGGLLFTAFLIEFDHATSRTQFCTSCHSMSFAEQSYRESAHFESASGVRASCGDCHVSPGLIRGTWDHLVGVRDFVKEVFGPDYSDPAINLVHLPDAAFSARNWFRSNDSATCRACHTQGAILGERANTAAIHREEAKDKTCIDCHYNLVHRKVPSEQTFKRDAWNAMIDEELGLEQGEAARLLEEGWQAKRRNSR